MMMMSEDRAAASDVTSRERDGAYSTGTATSPAPMAVRPSAPWVTDAADRPRR